MKIAVLSDTHSLILPKVMLEAFKKTDLIIHAGDVCDIDVLKQLQAIKPVKAVHGNMCDAPLKKKLPLRDIVEAEGVRIGITHGHVGETRDAMSNALALFAMDKVDVVVYGHSHLAFNEKIGKVLMFNPGSPNDVVKARFFSYGILHIAGSQVKGEIVRI